MRLANSYAIARRRVLRFTNGQGVCLDPQFPVRLSHGNLKFSGIALGRLYVAYHLGVVLVGTLIQKGLARLTDAFHTKAWKLSPNLI